MSHTKRILRADGFGRGHVRKSGEWAFSDSQEMRCGISLREVEDRIPGENVYYRPTEGLEDY